MSNQILPGEGDSSMHHPSTIEKVFRGAAILALSALAVKGVTDLAENFDPQLHLDSSSFASLVIDAPFDNH